MAETSTTAHDEIQTYPRDGETFRVMLRMEVVPGAEADFEQAWISGASVITDQPANLGQWLAKSTEEEAVYYIVSDWTDEVSFRTYEHSDTHLEHRSRLHPYRRSGSMSVAVVLYGMSGAAAESAVVGTPGLRPR